MLERLEPGELGEKAVLHEKLLAGTRFLNDAVGHRDDLGGVLDRREAVRDHEGRAALHQFDQGVLDLLLALAV